MEEATVPWSKDKEEGRSDGGGYSARSKDKKEGRSDGGG